MSFYNRLSEFYDIIFKAGTDQLALIQEVVPKGSRVLDVGCGTGTYAIPLAELGYQLVAIDPEPSMIERLRQKTKTVKLEVKSHVLDISGLQKFDQSPFNGVLCIGNTLAHLESRSAVERAIEIVAGVLDNHGTLILQTVNFDKVFRERQGRFPLIHRPESGVQFERHYDILKEDRIRFVGKLTMPDGSEETSATELIGIRAHFLETALKKAGFKDVKRYGDFKKSAWTLKSPATVFLAKKNI